MWKEVSALSDTNRNKTIARRLFDDVITARRLDVIDEIIASDSIDHSSRAGGASGREGFRQHVNYLLGATENLTVTVDDLVAEDDRVVVFWTIDAIHRGEIFGVPPTGRHFRGTSISLVSFEDGQVVDYSVVPDRQGIIAQLTSAVPA
jgi:predicted ester cyclase